MEWEYDVGRKEDIHDLKSDFITGTL